jgi:hypothetical protein
MHETESRKIASYILMQDFTWRSCARDLSNPLFPIDSATQKEILVLEKYFLFLRAIYNNTQLSAAYDQYLRSMKKLTIDEVFKLDVYTQANQPLRRIIFDAARDALINHTILNGKRYDVEVAKIWHSHQNVQAESYPIADILLNSIGYIGNQPSVTESHYQLLYTLCHVLASNGVRPRIFLLNMPFSGMDWPKGNSTLIANDCGEILRGLFQSTMPSLPIMPLIYSSQYSQESNYLYTLSNCVNALSFDHSFKRIASFDFACISGSFASYLPRLHHSPRYILTPCLNNRLHGLPFDVTSVLSQDAKAIVSNRPVSYRSLPFLPIRNKTLNGSVSPNLAKILAGTSTQSSICCVICSGYLGLVFESIKANSELYSCLSNARLFLYGNVEAELVSFFSVYFSSIDVFGRSECLYFDFSTIIKTQRAFFLIPYGMVGMGFAALTALEVGMPFVASYPHDVANYTAGLGFYKEKIDYADALKQLSTASGYDSYVSRVFLEVKNKYISHSEFSTTSFGERFLFDKLS